MDVLHEIFSSSSKEPTLNVLVDFFARKTTDTAQHHGILPSNTNISKTGLREFLSDSCKVSETQYGRDRSFRFFQYAGRLFHGAFGLRFCWQLSLVMALTRKGLRFYGPLVRLQEICRVLDEAKKKEVGAEASHKFGLVKKLLTCWCLLQDALYRLADHVTEFGILNVPILCVCASRRWESIRHWDKIYPFDGCSSLWGTNVGQGGEVRSLRRRCPGRG